MVAMATKFP
jgi:hypothetical protein